MENFRDCVEIEGGQIFYGKIDDRFEFTRGVYYTPKMAVACYWALHQISEIRIRRWREDSSIYLSSVPVPIPVILCGELSIWRRFPVVDPGYIDRFPVNSMFVLRDDIDLSKTLLSPLDPNVTNFFQPADPKLYLQELSQAK